MILDVRFANRPPKLRLTSPVELSLALIGTASGQTFGAEGVLIRGVFDKETRRKPLAFAADAGRYGI
jgi:hypothetical protein